MGEFPRQKNNSTRCTTEIARTNVRRLALRSPSCFRMAGALVSASLFQFFNAILSALVQIAVEAVAKAFSRIRASRQQSRSKFESVDHVRGRTRTSFAVSCKLNLSGAVRHPT